MPRRVRQPAVWIALVLALVGFGVWCVYLTRGTTLWFDEWSWVTERRGWNLDAFLRPHNGHFSLVPVAVYKLLFVTVGIDRSAPYRGLIIGVHLLCVLGLYVYAARRVGAVVAGLAAAIVLVLGPSWQDILWPFQIGFLTSLGAGVWALVALDRHDRAGDAAAAVLLMVSLASSGLGLVIAAGVVVELAWVRRRRGDAWIAGVPLVLYAIWSVAYQDTGIAVSDADLIPTFAADSLASALAALTGLNGPAVIDTGVTLGWGRPLALAATAGLAWGLARRRPIPPRLPALLAMPLAFWVLTAITRVHLSTPRESRYLYVGVLLLLLVAVELGAGIVLPRAARWGLGAAVAVAVLSNAGDLQGGAAFMRAQSLITRADLGAAEIAGSTAPRDAVLTGLPGYPLVVVRAGPYLDAVRALGSPAATPAQIAADPESARAVADAELVRLLHVAARPGPAGRPAGAAPAVDAASGGQTSERAGCVTFHPAAVTAPGAPPALDLTIPPGGLSLAAAGGPVDYQLRRFAAGFPGPSLGRLADGGHATLQVPADRAAQPWHVRLSPGAGVVACGLG